MSQDEIDSALATAHEIGEQLTHAAVREGNRT